MYPTIFKFHLTRDYQLNEMGKRQLRLLSLDGGDARGLDGMSPSRDIKRKNPCSKGANIKFLTSLFIKTLIIKTSFSLLLLYSEI